MLHSHLEKFLCVTLPFIVPLLSALSLSLMFLNSMMSGRMCMESPMNVYVTLLALTRALHPLFRNRSPLRLTLLHFPSTYAVPFAVPCMSPMIEPSFLLRNPMFSLSASILNMMVSLVGESIPLTFDAVSLPNISQSRVIVLL